MAKETLSLGERFANWGRAIWGNTGTINPLTGLIEGQSGFLGSLQNLRMLFFGGGYGLTQWAGALQGLSQNM